MRRQWGRYRAWCLHSLPPALWIRKMTVWYGKMHLGLDDVMSDAILFFLIARVVDGHFVSCLGVIVLWWPCSSESDEPVY